MNVRELPRWLLVVGVVAVALLVGGAAIALGGGFLAAGPAAPGASTAPQGPMAVGDHTTHGMRMRPADTITWGEPLWNDLSDPVTLLGVDLIEAAGVTLHGVVASDTPIGIALEYPPAGADTRDVEGTVIAPQTQRYLLFGVSLADAAATGAVRAIRLRYAIGDQHYEIELPRSLALTLDASPAP